jgi:hypothetical protein
MQNTILRTTPQPVERILHYRHERLLQRYVADNCTTKETAEQVFSGFKQFMVVCAVKPGPKITSEPIDRMWHCFLLFTKDYKEFCDNYLGRFINHEPFEQAAPDTYLETRAFAKDFFGDIDERLWPVEAKSDCSSGCGE